MSVGLNLDASERAAILGHPSPAADDRGPRRRTSPAARRSRSSRAPDLAINLHRIGDKQAAIHVIRYDYDEERDEVPVIPRCDSTSGCRRPFRMVKTFSPMGDVGAHLTFSRDVREMHRLELENVPLYFVALLQG